MVTASTLDALRAAHPAPAAAARHRSARRPASRAPGKPAGDVPTPLVFRPRTKLLLYAKLVPDNVRNKSGAATLSAHASGPSDGGKLAALCRPAPPDDDRRQGLPGWAGHWHRAGANAGSLASARAVFREAVRLLEQDGVAQMRRGPGGGLVVTAPRASSVARAAALHLQFFGAGADGTHSKRWTALELQNRRPGGAAHRREGHSTCSALLSRRRPSCRMRAVI